MENHMYDSATSHQIDAILQDFECRSTCMNYTLLNCTIFTRAENHTNIALTYNMFLQVKREMRCSLIYEYDLFSVLNRSFWISVENSLSFSLFFRQSLPVSYSFFFISFNSFQNVQMKSTYWKLFLALDPSKWYLDIPIHLKHEAVCVCVFQF